MLTCDLALDIDLAVKDGMMGDHGGLPCLNSLLKKNTKPKTLIKMIVRSFPTNQDCFHFLPKVQQSQTLQVTPTDC